MNRFTKISTTGEQLPDDATEWAAVLDNTTGLMWSTESIGKPDDDGDTQFEITQAEAVEACSALALAGFTDWRLPTVEELFALADRSRSGPAIDTGYFPACESDWYWSASAAAWAPESSAWLVGFGLGLAYSNLRGSVAFVRAVRCARVPAGQ